jgi:hypothetical protein
MYNKVRAYKYLPENVLVKNGLKRKLMLYRYCFSILRQNMLSHHQNGQSRDIKIPRRSFENASQFKYLGTTVTNHYSIKKEIKRRLYSGSS